MMEQLIQEIGTLSNRRTDIAIQVATKWSGRNLRRIREKTIEQAVKEIMKILSSDPQDREIPGPSTENRVVPNTNLSTSEIVLTTNLRTRTDNLPTTLINTDTNTGFVLVTSGGSIVQTEYGRSELSRSKGYTKLGETDKVTQKGRDTQVYDSRQSQDRQEEREEMEVTPPQMSLNSREEHFGNNDNWTLTPNRLIFMGDSNLSWKPQIPDNRLQGVSYPGAKFRNSYRILQHTSTAPEVHNVILSLFTQSE